MRTKRISLFLSLLFVLSLLISVVPSVSANQAEPTINSGYIQTSHGVFIKSHRVDVEITNQIAKTRVTQVFVNEGSSMAEGTYIFPLPKGVTISDLEMKIDGVSIQGNILEKDEARQIYDEIVRSLRDPALLEYIGTNAIQASVFPIPAGDERTLEIEFNQLLPVETGLVHYVYPLRTRHLTHLPVGELSIRVSVESNDAISNIYSPTHRVAIDRQSDTRFVVGFETTNTQETNDFSLYYGLANDQVNMNLLTYRESATENGFFVALVAPPFEVSQDRVIPKDVIVVLDNSGSMYGTKWDQAVEATKFVLDNLNEEDRFNVISFSTGVRVYGSELQGIGEVSDAKQWISTIEALGGTNINEALQSALQMSDQERQTVVLFLTDGLATEGIVDTADILKNVDAFAGNNISIFAFGVGDDVDTFLLDQLSDGYRGASVYVRPEENIDEEVSTLYNKIRAPLFTNISLAMDGVTIYDVYPHHQDLPDLFIGSQMVIVGRYQGDSDNVTLRLTGKVENEEVSFIYDDLDFRANAGGEVLIPRLWATRKIGELLNTIRLNGENEELVDSIVRLSIRYGIITPYTSYLITEDDIFTQSGRTDILEAEEQAFDMGDDVSGADAVEASEAARDLSNADSAAAPPSSGFGGGNANNGVGQASKDGDEGYYVGDDGTIVNRVQYVGDRTFAYRDGKWIDTLFDGDNMEPIEVEFLSDEYFDLLDLDERVAEFLAVGDAVIFVIDDVAYEIVPLEAE